MRRLRGRSGILILTGAAALALGAAACTVEERTDLPAQGSRGGAPTAAPAHFRQVVRPEGSAPSAVLSPAFRNGDLLWMSGRLGTVPGGSPSALVAGGVEAETLQALENVESVLAAAGLAREHVLKCTVFLADMADFAAMNGVYAAFFEGLEPPARSTVGVNGLALGARVEIECVAAYPPGR